MHIGRRQTYGADKDLEETVGLPLVSSRPTVPLLSPDCSSRRGLEKGGSAATQRRRIREDLQVYSILVSLSSDQRPMAKMATVSAQSLHPEATWGSSLSAFLATSNRQLGIPSTLIRSEPYGQQSTHNRSPQSETRMKIMIDTSNRATNLLIRSIRALPPCNDGGKTHTTEPRCLGIFVPAVPTR